ncbi:hypothetical protein NL676_000166 [Syzygium grande]|nr:hypothetical protein NL676_000166 [Syzygium grande]
MLLFLLVKTQRSGSGSSREVCHWRKPWLWGVVMSNEPTALYNGRITAFVAISCMVAATGGIIFGYDIGISGGVTSMEPFLKKFFRRVYDNMKEDAKISNYCKYDSQLLTSFTSSLYMSGLVASFFASPVTRAFGRKPSILVGGASFLAGSALGGAASNVYMLIFGRILLGVGVGFANQSVPLYISEMAPPRHRGLFNNGFQFCVGIGVLSANLINYGTEKIEGGWGWRISLAMAAVPGTILTLGALFLPETPNSLIQRSDNHEKAETMLRRIRGVNDVQAELNDLVKASSISKTVDHPFQNIIQREYRPQLVMSIAIPFFQQVTGINVISFYAPVLFRIIGLGESASLLSAVVTGLVGTISTFISMLLVDKLAMVGGILAAKLGDHGGISKAYAYSVLVLICIYVSGFAWSWGPLGWLVPSEIYPLEIRSAGQSITVAVGFLFTFLVAQTFLSMLCHFKSGIFFFFGGWVVIMTVFVYLLLPETKNVPIEQMDKEALAVGEAIEYGGTYRYNGRITPFVLVFACAVAATGGIIFGYDIGTSGGATSMDPFLKKFFPKVYNKMKEDTKISNYCKFDSQLLTLFTSSLYIAGLVASFFASSVTRYVGRRLSILAGGAAFLAGSALGGAASNVAMLIFGRVLLGIGVGFANQSVPCTSRKWRLPSSGIFSTTAELCLGIGILFANPIYYGAEKIEGVGAGESPSHGCSPCINPNTWKLLMIGGLQMLVAQVMVGGIMAAKLGDHGEISEAYAYYLVIVLVCVYADGFYWSWGPLGWLIPSEIFPLEIRSAGQGTMVAVGFLFIHLVAQTFLSTLCHFQSGLFFFFGGWAAIMTVFVHLLLLEMKNVPIEQMDKIWGEHWFWKKIVGEIDVKANKMEA